MAATDAIVTQENPMKTATTDGADKTPAAAAPATDHAVLPRFQFVMVFLTMCLGCFLAGLDGTIVVTAMPKIAAEFNALSIISWVIVSFMLTQTALTPLWGRMCDIFGRRNCMLFTVGVFVIGSMACALSTNIEQLIVFRALQGIGGGGIMSCVLILLADLTPPSSRAAYMAPIGSMFALSSVCGPLLGGLLTDGPGWRFAFWINVPIGGICLVIQWLYIPLGLGQQHTASARRKVRQDAEAKAAKETEGASAPAIADAAGPAPAAAAAEPAAEGAAPAKHHHHDEEDETIDYAGSLVIVVAIICLCLALVWGGAEYAWNSARIIALLTVAAVLLSVFIVIETKYAKHPIMPMRLFKVRNFSVGAAISFFAGMSMTGGYVYLPLFFQLVKMNTASQSGVAMIPMMLGLPVGAIVTGILVTKYGAYRPYPIIGSVMSIIASYLYTTMTDQVTMANQVGYLILGGLAMGPLVQVPLLAAQNAVSARDMPVTSSTVTFFQAVGGLLSTAIMQTILNNKLKEEFVPVMEHIVARLGLPPGTQLASSGSFDLEPIKANMPDIYQEVITAYTRGVTAVFWLGVGTSVLSLVASLAMEHIKLKDGLADHVHVEGAPPPHLPEELLEEAPVSLASPADPEAVPSTPSKVVVEAH